MSRISAFFLLAAVVSMFALPPVGHAQYRIQADGESPTVYLELAKPFFEDQAGDFGFATMMLDATLVVPLATGPTLFGRLGLAHATLDGFDASTLIYNPRVGVLFSGEGGTDGELHVDIPLASEVGDDDYATGVAFVSDPERLSRFNPDGWGIGGTISPQTELASGGTLGGRVGAEAWIPTDSDLDTEVVAIYSGFGRAALGDAFVEAELSGIAILTEDDVSFGERTLLLGTLTVSFPAVGVAPEVFIRLPLDEDTRDLPADVTIGVRLRLGG